MSTLFEFPKCYDADVVTKHPAATDADLELVVVLDTNDPYAFALAEGCLEEADIPFFVLNKITTLVNDVDPFSRKWLRIQVARDREAEAREIIAAALQPCEPES
jgi:hypothetical protein